MKLGIFLALAVLLGCTSANLHPKNPKSDKKTALVDRYLEKKAGIENPEDSLKRKDWVRYVEQKVAEHLKADEEKTEKKHENARSNPLLSKLLRPSGSDVTAVKPADLERVSSQHIRQPEQEVEGYISRYGRRGQEDNVMKMREVMRHVGEISREDGGEAAELVPSFLLGHNSVQSGSRHEAHEGHAPMVDPEEEEGHEHPDPGVLTGKHSESLHHGLKQSLQGLDHARAEDAGRGSGHQVHPHQKHQESIHAPHPVGEENNPKEQEEESSSADEGDAENADPTPSNKDDGGAAAANSIVEKIQLMQKMAALAKASDSESTDPTQTTAQAAQEEDKDDGGSAAANSIVEKIKLMQKMAALAKASDSENVDPTQTTAQAAQEEGTDDAGAAAANSIVEKIQLMQKMAELAKASDSENADPTPPKTAQAAQEKGTDDAGAATANSIVEKIKLMQKMAELAKASDSENADPTPPKTAQAAQEKGTDDAGAAAANSIVEKIQLMQKMAALAKASDSENTDSTPKTKQATEKEGTDDAGAAAANSIVEKIQLMQRMAAMAKMMKKMKEGSEEDKEEALEEAKGMLPPEVLSAIKSKLDAAPGDLDKDDLDKDAGRTAERPSPSPLVREKLRQSGRLHPVTKEDKASNGEKQTEGTEDSEVDAGKTEDKAEVLSMQESPPADHDKDDEKPAQHSPLSSLRRERLIESGRLVTNDETTSDDDVNTAKGHEYYEKDAKQSKEAEPTMEESPKILRVLQSGENEETPKTNEEAAANSDGPANALGAIMKAMAIAKAQQDTSASTGVTDQGSKASEDLKPALTSERDDSDGPAKALGAIMKAMAIAKLQQDTSASTGFKDHQVSKASEDSKPALTPEDDEKKLQVIEAIRHATEAAKGHKVSSAGIEADDQGASKNKEKENLDIDNNHSDPKAAIQEESTSHDKEDAARALEKAIKKAVAMAKEGRQETPASAEAMTPEPAESQQPALTHENKEKELQVMEAIKHAMEFAKRREENSVSTEAEVHVAKSLEAADSTLTSENKEEEQPEVINNTEAPKIAPNQDDKLDSDRNAFNVLQQVSELRKLKHMASDEESKNDDQGSQKENTIVDDVGSLDRIANNKPQSEVLDEPSKDQGKEEKAHRVLDTMAELRAAAAKQKDQSKEEKAKMVLATMAGLQAAATNPKQQHHSKEVSAKTEEKSQGNNLGGKSQAEQAIMETIGKLRREAEDRAHVQEVEEDDRTPEATQAAEGKDIGETDEEPSINTEPSSPAAGDAENVDPTPETATQGEDKDDAGATETKSIVEKIQLMQRMAALAKMMKKMKEGSEEEKEEALEEAKEMLPPAVLSVVQAKIAEESGNQENTKDDLKEETAGEASEAKVEDEVDENQGTQEAGEDIDEERAGEEAGENIEQGEEKVQFKKVKSVEGLNLAVAEPGDHMDNIENDKQTVKESDEENLSKGVEGTLVENKNEEQNKENLAEESEVLNDVDEAQDVMNPQKDQDGQKSEDSLREEDEDDAPLETSQENTQGAEENIKTGQEKEDTNGDQNNQGEQDVGETKEKDPLARLAKIKATLTHLQGQDEDKLVEKSDETGKEEEDDETPAENQKPDDETTTNNGKIEAKIAQLQGLADEKETEGEGSEAKPVRVPLSQKAAAVGKAERKAVIAAVIAQSHLKAHGIKVPKSKEQPDGPKHHEKDATSVKKTTYYLSEEGQLRSSDEILKEDKNSKIPIIKNNLLTEVKTSQETLEEVNSGGYKIKSPQEQLKEEKETARSVENKGLEPASPFLKGAFMIHNTARQEKPDKVHLQSGEKTSKIPPNFLSREKEMEKSSFLLPKDGKVKISKEVLPGNKKEVRSDEKKLTGLLPNAADVMKTKLGKPDNQPKTAGKKLSPKPKSLFGKAVKAGKHRNLAKLREMAMAMAKRRLPRGRRTAP